MDDYETIQLFTLCDLIPKVVNLFDLMCFIAAPLTDQVSHFKFFWSCYPNTERVFYGTINS